MTVLHTYFLGLAAIGYDALWGTLIKSGTAKAIAAVKATGTLPDGNILRQIYTGLPSIDRLLISPVIFYDGLMRQRNPIFRSLLVGLFCTMQTTSFCIISAGWLHKSPRWWIIMYVLDIISNIQIMLTDFREPIFWGWLIRATVLHLSIRFTSLSMRIKLHQPPIAIVLLPCHPQTQRHCYIQQ